MSMWSSEVSAGPIVSPGAGSAGAGTRDCGVPWATRLPRGVPATMSWPRFVYSYERNLWGSGYFAQSEWMWV